MPLTLNAADAAKFLIAVMKQKPPTMRMGAYGYDIFINDVAREFVAQNLPNRQLTVDDSEAEAVSPAFLDAAWALCQRGILRPSITTSRGQGIGGGQGYSLTEIGKAWVASAAPDDFFNLGAERLQRLLQPHASRFGRGFLRRAMEAADCHVSGNYLACCVMCGGAAEAILLAASKAKVSDEAKVLATYRSASGRRRTLDGLIGQAPGSIQKPFSAMMELIGYWRDEAGHGDETDITELEAHEALTRLVRLTKFADDNWEELTRRDALRQS